MPGPVAGPGSAWCVWEAALTAGCKRPPRELAPVERCPLPQEASPPQTRHVLGPGRMASRAQLFTKKFPSPGCFQGMRLGTWLLGVPGPQRTQPCTPTRLLKTQECGPGEWTGGDAGRIRRPGWGLRGAWQGPHTRVPSGPAESGATPLPAAAWAPEIARRLQMPLGLHIPGLVERPGLSVT